MANEALKKTSKGEKPASHETIPDGGQSGPTPPKKSLYQRYVDAKRGRNVQISDADLLKYTGKTKEELNEWSKDRPGVGKNQPAGKLAMGPAVGLGGLEVADGYGGWGPSAEAELNFPPKPRQDKKMQDEEDEGV
ncbi:hypothetical protein C8A00DRAFT_16771 [Chaetomidium leptoderma]|uniref:Uncharacterized protein n=1 Tax=Chaetomidium leptoderma TaxID=669021 RepID=A0AAN6VHX3_9PEZI|nr:hypothetical protein C8A00DRAFT_16771 [Chaetomidium leptoderma]